MWIQGDNIIRYAALRDSLEKATADGKMTGPVVRTVQEWLNFLHSDSPRLHQLLQAVYGPSVALQESRLRQIVGVLHLFARCYGEQREVVVVRAPGRINLMGRHIDHRGGYVNMMTIHRELVVVASARSDGWVHLANASSEFQDDRFDLYEELPYIRGCRSWQDYINSQRVRDFHSTSMGQWSNYVKAGLYRLAHHFPEHRFYGMDLAVGGDIPIGAGLSSSSALLVGTSMAAIALNGLDVMPATFVDLCGEGEWFVGTRGGSADHAAMTLAVQGNVTPITFFPFNIEDPVVFPSEVRLLACNSGVQAKKTKGARDAFNHRVACYELAMALFRKFFPKQTEEVRYLRDIPGKMTVSLPEFYQMVKRLPLQAGRFLLRQLLQDRSDWLEKVFETHREPTVYPLRSVFLYGVAECQRSKTFTELLQKGDLDTIGQLMGVSHDGDRVVSFGNDGSARLWSYDCSDASLDRLSLLAASDDPEEAEKAALHRQAGGYACSCWEIDQMVDAALRVPGVVGAQLSGAGMGGCMMVLARDSAVEQVRETLAEHYYEPRGMEPQVEICCPIAGACCLMVG